MTEELEPIAAPPPGLLEFLDQAEAQLSDLDDLRAQIHALREAVQRSPLPTAAEVEASVRDVSLSDHVTVTDELTIERWGADGGRLEGDASIEVQVEIVAAGEVGEAPPVPSRFYRWAKDIGPVALQAVRLAWDVINQLNT